MVRIEANLKNIIEFILKKILHLKISDDIIERIIQFAKFGIVGISNTLISYVIYVVFVAFGCYYLVASLLGFLVSVMNAFYWNNKYVFKVEEGEKRTVWSSFVKTFVSYAGTGLILNNILLILWIDVFKIHEMLGPIINLFITIPLNFLLNKFWAFKEKTREEHKAV